MKKEWLYAVGLVCLVSACTGTPQSSADDELCSIDVAGAMEKPAELKLSELGSDVRYVPLETTDSCLVVEARIFCYWIKRLLSFHVKLVLSLIKRAVSF